MELTKEQQEKEARLEIYNGLIEKVGPISAAGVLYAKTNSVNSFDETVVTVRAAEETFSFAASDLAKYGHIFLPDFGVIVRKAGDNIARTHVKIRHLVVQVVDVLLAPRPHLGTSRIDDLDGVSPGGFQEPCDVCGERFEVVVPDVFHDEPVIAEEWKCSLVDDRRIFKFLVRVFSFYWRHSRFDDGRVSHLCIPVPGREC